MVTITHDMKSAFRIADRVAMLRSGQIVAVAAPDVFRSLSDPYIQKFLAGEPLEEDGMSHTARVGLFMIVALIVLGCSSSRSRRSLSGPGAGVCG